MDRNQFLVSLYNEVSPLSDCRTLQFIISYDKNRVELIINMPSYADMQSEKWKKAKYNDILVQIDFACPKKIELESKEQDYHGDTDILKDENTAKDCTSGRGSTSY